MTEEQNEQSPECGGIYCANCRYCVLFRKASGIDGSQYLLRVKCTQEQWRKKLGEEKMYKYFSLFYKKIVDFVGEKNLLFIAYFCFIFHLLRFNCKSGC